MDENDQRGWSKGKYTCEFFTVGFVLGFVLFTFSFSLFSWLYKNTNPNANSMVKKSQAYIFESI